VADSLAVSGGDISLVLTGDRASAQTLVVLGHGAGSGLDSEFMAFFAERLGAAGLVVARFNFLYMEQGRKVPDRQPVLERTYREVVEHLTKSHAGLPLVIGGKSMGGRIASHVATTTSVDGLVFLGYPLHPPGRPDRMRDAHLSDVKAPMLFVEGTRDPFCPLDTLESVRARLPHSSLVIIEDGDHSFKVRKSSGRSTQDAWVEAVSAIASWVKQLRAAV
jgi:predicted alpha/beta-hydrolase family hydrolase